LNTSSIIKNFFINHWEWACIMIVSILGVIITYRAYKHTKQTAKKAARESLFNAALDDFRSKGEPAAYLLGRWESFKKEGWTQKEFEEIYREVYRLHKNGKEPGIPLFKSKSN